MQNDGILYVITGPTASGKTAKAVALAHAISAEIVSADSRQVYRGMDLGTGKDLDEYGDVPYHLIDICPAGYKYNLYEYLRDSRQAIDSIRLRQHNVILCGGTGLYIESVLKGIRLPDVPQNAPLRQQLQGKTIDELTAMLAAMKTLHNTTDVDTCQRAIRAIEIQAYYRQHPEAAALAQPQPVGNALIIVTDIDVASRRRRITQRLQARLDAGMADEVRALIASGISAESLMYYGLEYKYVTQHVIGQTSRDEMFRLLETAIHQFAKRQMTWFRGMERRGFRLHYIPYDLQNDAFVARVLQLKQQEFGQ